ncbi:hypothetical protein DFH06DRAFT_1120444 [Mycena polygramma]|nr:hypothetical protein DFH06DRAFT_1120444 [Mycena polygramma]
MPTVDPHVPLYDIDEMFGNDDDDLPEGYDIAHIMSTLTLRDLRQRVDLNADDPPAYSEHRPQTPRRQRAQAVRHPPVQAVSSQSAQATPSPVTQTPRRQRAQHPPVQRVIPQSPKSPKAAYIVFRGRRVGVFYSWGQVAAATAGLSFAIQQGYATPELAIASFEVAQQHGWTYESATASPETLPRDAPLPIRLGDDPEGGLFRRDPGDPFYVVYAGINPGVFGTYLECALNVLAVPASSHKRFPTYAEALRRFQEGLT